MISVRDVAIQSPPAAPVRLHTVPTGAGPDVVALVRQLNSRVTAPPAPSFPTSLYAVASHAGLPSAADFPFCALILASESVLLVSNGANWIRQDNLAVVQP